MTDYKTEKPRWAWFVLICGGLFLLNSFPGIFLYLLLPFWKSDEFNFFTIVLMVISLCILIVTIWGMKRAYNTIRASRQMEPATLSIEGLDVPQPSADDPSKQTKSIWPWLVIIPGVLLLVNSGPGVMMLPIMPLFLAGMSTDSGTAPDYVPILIILIGYGLMIGYVILLVKAIKALRIK